MNRRELREVSLWLVIFSITATFQFWRASELDGLIFIVIIALLAISAFSERDFNTLGGNPRFARWGGLYLIALLAILATSHIHTLPPLVAMLAAAPLLLISREKHEHIPPAKIAITRSAIAWSILALALAFWELFSYILGALSGDDARTPTISMLIDPAIQHNDGRILFVIVWGYIGYELLFLKKRRR